MAKISKLPLTIAAAAMLLPASAMAIPFTSGSVTDMGVVYTLSTDGVDHDAGSAVAMDFTLKVDTTGYSGTGGAGAYLVGASIKIANSLTGGSLLSGPTNAVEQLGGTSSGGCKLSTVNGFDCAKDTPPSGDATDWQVGSVYTFVFREQFASLSDLINPPSIKAVYDYYNSKDEFVFASQTSKTAGAGVPEPTSLALLGLGMIGLGAISMRRKA